MIIGYLDNNEKNIDIEAQQKLVLNCAENSSLTVDLILSDKTIKNLPIKLKTGGHILLVANVLALGDSLTEIIDSIDQQNTLHNTVICAAENLTFAPTEKTQDIIVGLRLANNIRSSLTSILTKKVLQQRKAKGQKLGRALGAVNRKTIASEHREFILQSLNQGISKAAIARILHISPRSVYNVLSCKNIQDSGCIEHIEK